ncbi:MAG: sulfite exporter TauE/SafE family protein [Bacteroidales bacterium]|jgi:sulfite exporter TauE/SafE|nr:sulfite exporter TauE/SafE family protein [Bacteroidales bacterium]
MQFELTTALMMGLIGSFHCAGMCGPIAIALPYGKKVIIRGLLYNIGRTFTYVLLGVIFGILGKGLDLGGFQQYTSIIAGVLMILIAIIPLLAGKQYSVERLGGKISLLFGKIYSRLVTNVKSISFLWIGLLNGLLPCGLVYAALAGAISSADAAGGALFMLVFGLGTIPMMLLLGMVSGVISSRLRNRMNKIIPIFVVIIGMLFIIRGLGLGIPYLSPVTEKLHINAKTGDIHKPACCSGSN